MKKTQQLINSNMKSINKIKRMANTQVNNESVKHYVKLLREDRESIIQEIKEYIFKTEYAFKATGITTLLILL